MSWRGYAALETTIAREGICVFGIQIHSSSVLKWLLRPRLSAVEERFEWHSPNHHRCLMETRHTNNHTTKWKALSAT